MSVIDEWVDAMRNLSSCRFLDMNDSINQDKIKLLTSNITDTYPYIIILDLQSKFYSTKIKQTQQGTSLSIWELRDEILDWLAPKSYYMRQHTAVICFEHKQDAMEFILRWK